jgi:hypothetical protein
VKHVHVFPQSSFAPPLRSPMPRRAQSPFPGPPSTTLRWIAVGEKETHSPDAKMSDTLLHFLDPLLALEEDPSPETIREVLRMGAMIWNLGAFAMPEWRKQIDLPIDLLAELRKLAAEEDAPERIFQITEALLHRRRTLFGKDLRSVVDYEILPDPTSKFRLRCTWALPDR